MTDLTHWGVLGMKWGRRKSADTTPDHSEHVRMKETTKKTARKLSSKEMQEAISRINLEKQYSQVLSEKNHPYMKKAQELFANAVVTVGGQLISKAVSDNAAKLIKYALQKKADAASAIDALKRL